MKLQKFFLTLACWYLCGSYAQAEDATGIPGFLLPNGAFRPMPPPKPSATVTPEAATVFWAGIINVNVTIQILSSAAYLTPSSIKCELALSVFDTDGTNTNEIRESDFFPATVAGSTANCALKIPYYWNLYNPAADAINMNVVIKGLDATNKGRTNFLTLSPIGVPATGTITTLAVTTRL